MQARLVSTSTLVLFTVAGLSWLILGCAHSGDGELKETQGKERAFSDAKKARLEALGKRRRIFFNDDTYELSREDANTPEGFLGRRLQPLVGTHVDVIAWSILGGWADAPVYDSKIQPIYGDAHGGPSPYWPAVTRNIKELVKGGRCPLQIVIDFAHENGMEVFASVRMNDSHDSFIPGGVTLWKKKHPEFLVDPGSVPRDKDKHPLGLYAIAQDFAHQEVRDRKFEIMEEVCTRYDIDGVGLNFIRHPVFFSRTMEGLPVTEEETEIMTGFMQRVRELTDKMGTHRGRPILLATTVPDNFQLAKRIGLDVKKWIQQDLIDIVVPGLGYAPFSLPVEDFVELAHPHGVKVYPCINRKAPQRVSDDAVSEGFRAVATNWYKAGADGLYFWNLGTPFEYKEGEELVEIRQRYYATLGELGEAAELVGKDKLFSVDDPVLDYYAHVSSQPPLPVTLSSQQVHRIPFDVGDDLVTEAGKGLLSELRLSLQIEDSIPVGNLVFRLNGEKLEHGEVITEVDGLRQIDYQVTAPPVKQGHNTFEASLEKTAKAGESARLTRLRLWVRYEEK